MVHRRLPWQPWTKLYNNYNYVTTYLLLIFFQLISIESATVVIHEKLLTYWEQTMSYACQNERCSL